MDELPSDDEARTKRLSVLKRLQALVDDAKRQERIEQRVWRYFLIGIPVAVLAFGLCILLFALLSKVNVATLLQERIAYFLADKISTKVVVVPRPYEPGWQPIYVAYARKVEAQIETAASFKFIKDPHIPPEAWTVGISMRINKNGFLERATLIVPSTVAEINKAACQVMTQAFPFDAPPPEALNRKDATQYSRWVRFHHSGAIIIDRYDLNAFTSTKPSVDCSNLR